MHSFLSKVFGRKEKDKETSPTTLRPGELLDGKFEAISPNVSPSAANFLELDSKTDGENGKDKDKDVGFSLFRAKSRPSPPEITYKTLATLPQLSLNFGATNGESTANTLESFLSVDPDAQILLSDAIIGRRRLNPLEALVLIRACSQAIVSRGLETLGIMHPHWYSASPEIQRRLISQFIHSMEPKTPLTAISLTPALASPFESEINFTRSPHDVAAVLRWGLRHLQLEGDNFGTDDGWYKAFLDAEAAAEYPPKAFSEKLAPTLPKAHLELLTATLEIFSSLAAHSEANSTSGSKLSKIFGLWLLTSRRVEDKDDWKSFYARWERTGRMLEHLFLSRIRDESTDQRMPVRLLELVRRYPYTQGLSSPTTDLQLLSPPRFTTQCYDALYVRIEVELPSERRKPKLKVHPLNILADAFSTKVEGGEYAELWAKITAASKNGSNPSPLSNIFADETIRFLSIVPDKSSGKAQEAKSPAFSLLPVSPSTARGHSFSVGEADRPSPSSARGHSFSVGETSRPAPATHSKSATEPSPVSATSPLAIGSDWVQFSSSGFLDSTPAIAPLVSTLFDTDVEKTVPVTMTLSRKSSKRGKAVSRKSVDFASEPAPAIPPAPIDPVTKEATAIVRATKLEVIELDEAFIDFWSDSLLDPITAKWPTFIICKFKSTLVPQLLYGPIEEGQKQKTLKWLVLEQVFTVRPAPPPSPSAPLPETSRPVSPALSTSGKNRFSFWSMSRTASSSSQTSQKGKKKEKAAAVGEMGELLEEETAEQVKDNVVKLKSVPSKSKKSKTEKPAEPVLKPADTPVVREVAEAPVSEAKTPVAEPQVPVAEAQIPAAEAEVPAPETQVPIAEAEAPIPEVRVPVAEVEAASEVPASDAQVPVIESAVPVVEAEAPVSESISPIVDAQALATGVEEPIVEVPSPPAEVQPPVDAQPRVLVADVVADEVAPLDTAEMQDVARSSGLPSFEEVEHPTKAEAEAVPESEIPALEAAIAEAQSASIVEGPIAPQVETERAEEDSADVSAVELDPSVAVDQSVSAQPSEVPEESDVVSKEVADLPVESAVTPIQVADPEKETDIVPETAQISQPAEDTPAPVDDELNTEEDEILDDLSSGILVEESSFEVVAPESTVLEDSIRPDETEEILPSAEESGVPVATAAAAVEHDMAVETPTVEEPSMPAVEQANDIKDTASDTSIHEDVVTPEDEEKQESISDIDFADIVQSTAGDIPFASGLNGVAEVNELTETAEVVPTLPEAQTSDKIVEAAPALSDVASVKDEAAIEDVKGSAPPTTLVEAPGGDAQADDIPNSVSNALEQAPSDIEDTPEDFDEPFTEELESSEGPSEPINIVSSVPVIESIVVPEESAADALVDIPAVPLVDVETNPIVPSGLTHITIPIEDIRHEALATVQEASFSTEDQDTESHLVHESTIVSGLTPGPQVALSTDKLTTSEDIGASLQEHATEDVDALASEVSEGEADESERMPVSVKGNTTSDFVEEDLSAADNEAPASEEQIPRSTHLDVEEVPLAVVDQSVAETPIEEEPPVSAIEGLGDGVAHEVVNSTVQEVPAGESVHEVVSADEDPVVEELSSPSDSAAESNSQDTGGEELLNAQEQAVSVPEASIAEDDALAAPVAEESTADEPSTVESHTQAEDVSSAQESDGSLALGELDEADIAQLAAHKSVNDSTNADASVAEDISSEVPVDQGPSSEAAERTIQQETIAVEEGLTTKEPADVEEVDQVPTAMVVGDSPSAGELGYNDPVVIAENADIQESAITEEPVVEAVPATETLSEGHPSTEDSVVEPAIVDVLSAVPTQVAVEELAAPDLTISQGAPRNSPEDSAEALTSTSQEPLVEETLDLSAENADLVEPVIEEEDDEQPHIALEQTTTEAALDPTSHFDTAEEPSIPEVPPAVEETPIEEEIATAEEHETAEEVFNEDAALEDIAQAEESVTERDILVEGAQDIDVIPSVERQSDLKESLAEESVVQEREIVEVSAFEPETLEIPQVAYGELSPREETTVGDGNVEETAESSGPAVGQEDGTEESDGENLRPETLAEERVASSSESHSAESPVAFQEAPADVASIADESTPVNEGSSEPIPAAVSQDLDNEPVSPTQGQHYPVEELVPEASSTEELNVSDEASTTISQDALLLTAVEPTSHPESALTPDEEPIPSSEYDLAENPRADVSVPTAEPTPEHATFYEEPSPIKEESSHIETLLDEDNGAELPQPVTGTTPESEYIGNSAPGASAELDAEQTLVSEAADPFHSEPIPTADLSVEETASETPVDPTSLAEEQKEISQDVDLSLVQESGKDHSSTELAAEPISETFGTAHAATSHDSRIGDSADDMFTEAVSSEDSIENPVSTVNASPTAAEESEKSTEGIASEGTETPALSRPQIDNLTLPTEPSSHEHPVSVPDYAITAEEDTPVEVNDLNVTPQDALLSEELASPQAVSAEVAEELVPSEQDAPEEQSLIVEEPTPADSSITEEEVTSDDPPAFVEEASHLAEVRNGEGLLGVEAEPAIEPTPKVSGGIESPSIPVDIDLVDDDHIQVKEQQEPVLEAPVDATPSTEEVESLSEPNFTEVSRNDNISTPAAEPVSLPEASSEEDPAPELQIDQAISPTEELTVVPENVESILATNIADEGVPTFDSPSDDSAVIESPVAPEHISPEEAISDADVTSPRETSPAEEQVSPATPVDGSTPILEQPVSRAVEPSANVNEDVSLDETAKASVETPTGEVAASRDAVDDITLALPEQPIAEQTPSAEEDVDISNIDTVAEGVETLDSVLGEEAAVDADVSTPVEEPALTDEHIANLDDVDIAEVADTHPHNSASQKELNATEADDVAEKDVESQVLASNEEPVAGEATATAVEDSAFVNENTHDDAIPVEVEDVDVPSPNLGEEGTEAHIPISSEESITEETVTTPILANEDTNVGNNATPAEGEDTQSPPQISGEEPSATNDNAAAESMESQSSIPGEESIAEEAGLPLVAGPTSGDDHTALENADPGNVEEVEIPVLASDSAGEPTTTETQEIPLEESFQESDTATLVHSEDPVIESASIPDDSSVHETAEPGVSLAQSTTLASDEGESAGDVMESSEPEHIGSGEKTASNESPATVVEVPALAEDPTVSPPAVEGTAVPRDADETAPADDVITLEDSVKELNPVGPTSIQESVLEEESIPEEEPSPIGELSTAIDENLASKVNQPENPLASSSPVETSISPSEAVEESAPIHLDEPVGEPIPASEEEATTSDTNAATGDSGLAVEDSSTDSIDPTAGDVPSNITTSSEPQNPVSAEEPFAVETVEEVNAVLAGDAPLDEPSGNNALATEDSIHEDLLEDANIVNEASTEDPQEAAEPSPSAEEPTAAAEESGVSAPTTAEEPIVETVTTSQLATVEPAEQVKSSTEDGGPLDDSVSEEALVTENLIHKDPSEETEIVDEGLAEDVESEHHDDPNVPSSPAEELPASVDKIDESSPAIANEPAVEPVQTSELEEANEDTPTRAGDSDLISEHTPVEPSGVASSVEKDDVIPEEAADESYHELQESAPLDESTGAEALDNEEPIQQAVEEQDALDAVAEELDVEKPQDPDALSSPGEPTPPAEAVEEPAPVHESIVETPAEAVAAEEIVSGETEPELPSGESTVEPTGPVVATEEDDLTEHVAPASSKPLAESSEVKPAVEESAHESAPATEGNDVTHDVAQASSEPALEISSEEPAVEESTESIEESAPEGSDVAAVEPAPSSEGEVAMEETVAGVDETELPSEELTNEPIGPASATEKVAVTNDVAPESSEPTLEPPAQESTIEESKPSTVEEHSEEAISSVNPVSLADNAALESSVPTLEPAIPEESAPPTVQESKEEANSPIEPASVTEQVDDVAIGSPKPELAIEESVPTVVEELREVNSASESVPETEQVALTTDIAPESSEPTLEPSAPEIAIEGSAPSTTEESSEEAGALAEDNVPSTEATVADAAPPTAETIPAEDQALFEEDDIHDSATEEDLDDLVSPITDGSTMDPDASFATSGLFALESAISSIGESDEDPILDVDLKVSEAEDDVLTGNGHHAKLDTETSDLVTEDDIDLPLAEAFDEAGVTDEASNGHVDAQPSVVEVPSDVSETVLTVLDAGGEQHTEKFDLSAPVASKEAHVDTAETTDSKTALPTAAED